MLKYRILVSSTRISHCLITDLDDGTTGVDINAPYMLSQLDRTLGGCANTILLVIYIGMWEYRPNTRGKIS